MNYNFEQVVSKILSTPLWGNSTGVVVFKQMLERLGNPQCGIPFVHVAGTNGKGSTTAFISKILEQAGMKVGMFTSPHLVTFEERIQINGVYISKEDVTRLGNILFQTQFDEPPTMFDYCLAMAVLYFREQECDIMVIETGIGGRYDSTNALGVPEVAVITKIGFDHMGVLGNTLEEIAGEKAGIIKRGCLVVVQEQEPPVADVIRRTALSEGATIYMISEEACRFVREIPMRMTGAYQIENAATAALTVRVLCEKWKKEKLLFGDMFEDFGISSRQDKIESFIHKGISETFWKGRMEIVNENPFFMIDGAHNSHGVCALASSLQELYPGEKFHFIMGVMADKDYEEMIDVLLPLAIDFVTVTPESSRALQSKDLAECIQRKGVIARYAENMEEVIRPLLPTGDVTTITKQDGERHIYLAGSENKTVAFGSLYFIGAIEAMLEENSKGE